MRILIIEDDPVIGKNLQTMLTRASYAADRALTVSDAYQKCIDESFDLIILDWMLPDGDGPSLCKKLRDENITCPILMLTARHQNSDTIEGLNSGADDYLTKPFVMEVLLARVRALLRRGTNLPLETILHVADLMIDQNTYTVTRGDHKIELSPREFALLHYLVLHKNQALDRMMIMSHVWNEQTDAFSNTVDVHIRYLRQKIDDPFDKKLIQTVKGKGYMVCDS